MSYGVGLRNGVAFALGTIPSLTSGGGLRPSLLLNFLSGTLDSRITFSRGTQATQYTSNGTLQYAPNNLLTYSNQYDNAAWSKSNSFVQTNLLTYSQDFSNAAWSKTSASVAADTAYAPDGTLTADVITSSGDATVVQVISGSANVAYTGSVWLRSPSGNRTINIYRNDNGTGFSVSPVTVTAVWQRFTITATSSGTATTVLFQVGGGGTFSSGAVLEVWGAQLVQGSVPGDYRATTSAALPVLYADYQGNLRARKLCENTAAATQHAVISGSLAVNSFYVTLSVKVKAAERSVIGLYANTIGKGQYFNLATGTVGAILISAPYSASITPLTNGYYLCSITVAAGSFEGLSVYLTDGSTITYAGDGSSGIYIADAQLEAGSTVQAYNDTTSAAYYGPRFDYEPVTKVLRGLLIEEQRVNLLLQSNDFQTSWTPTNITRTLASTTGPDGTLSGVKIAGTAAVFTELYQDAVVAATSATASVYVKLGTGATIANSFGIRNVTTATNLIIGTLNYSTGVWTYSTGSTGVTVTNVGNGWWRLQISATASITSGDTIRFYVGYLGATPTAGDFLYAYGAQLEAGAFATSYIPTVGSQVTRAADSASITTLTPWFNAAAGTLVTSFITAPSSVSPQYFAEFDDGTANNAMYNARDNSGNGIFQVVNGGVSQAALGLSTLANSTTGKIASAYAVNDFGSSKNGGSPVLDSSGTIPTVTILRIGANVSGGVNANFINGWMSNLSYYPTRLPNATLQGLTV